MNLREAREAYYEKSGKASDRARALALSGIAIIWVFRIESELGPKIPSQLVLSGLFIVLALALDLLQYVTGAAAWGRFHRGKEKAGTKDDAEFDAPRSINWAASTCFVSKLVSVAVAYVLMITYLTSVLL